MTFQINQSFIDALPYDYAAEVEKFRQAKLAHRFIGNAAPTAPAIIERAVRRVPQDSGPDDFVADYEIVNDIPEPHVPTLDEKKAALRHTLQQAEQAACNAVMAPGYRRMLHLRAGNVFTKAEADRSDAEKATVAEHDALVSKDQAIQLHAASQEMAIDDLTAESVDSWKAEPFPS